jgi:hypothetical protein
MRQRGRKSSTEILTDLVVDVRQSMPVRPPSELTDAQAGIWRDVVGSLPAVLFKRATFPNLIAYCRHACRARLLEMQVARFEPEWTKVKGGLERLDKLLALCERETRAMIACARTLRLTPQAQMHARTAGRAIDNTTTGPFPWDR